MKAWLGFLSPHRPLSPVVWTAWEIIGGVSDYSGEYLITLFFEYYLTAVHLIDQCCSEVFDELSYKMYKMNVIMNF